MKLGQVIGGWTAQLTEATVRASLAGRYPLALGGTAVGTGLPGVRFGAFLQIATHASPQAAIDGYTRRQPYSPKGR